MISFSPKISTVDYAIRNTVLAKLNSILEKSRTHQNPDLYDPSFSIGRSLYPVSMTHGLSREIDQWNNRNGDESRLLIDEISDNTLSFGPMTLFDGLSLIKDEIKSGDFYGVVAVNSTTKERINPLHPLVAQDIAEHWDTYKDQEFTFYVFSGNWRSDPDTDLERYTDSIAQLLSDYSRRQQISYTTSTIAIIDYSREIPISSEDRVSEILDSYMSRKPIALIDTTSLKLEDGEAPYFIVPVQIISNGVAYPYYGTSLLQQDTNDDTNDNEDNEDTKELWGTDLSPMGSANIGRNTSNPVASEFYSVCTGGHGTDEYGMATINQSNLQSPMNSECLSPCWREYVAACLNVSYEILDPLLSYAPPKVLTRANFDTTEEWLYYLSNLHTS